MMPIGSKKAEMMPIGNKKAEMMPIGSKKAEMTVSKWLQNVVNEYV